VTARAARIGRIRDLLEVRRHPERRVGIFSATNLTRVVLRLAAMGAAFAVVRRLLGEGAASVVVGAIAVALADESVARLWRRVGRRVQQGWAVVGTVAALVLLGLGLTMAVSPRATAFAGAWLDGWLEARRSALDRSVAARRIPVDPAATVGPHWRLLVDSGAAVLGTRAEADAACAALGPGWALPPGLGAWPELERYPDLGTTLYVWSLGGSGIQIGDGKPPSGAVSSSGRATETHGILCLEGAP
jgi:hypothetical protein